MSLVLWVGHVLEVSSKPGEQQSCGGQSIKNLIWLLIAMTYQMDGTIPSATNTPCGSLHRDHGGIQ